METGYKVGDVMTAEPVTLGPDDDLVKCAQEMTEQHVGAILVKDGTRVEGILTEQDIVRKVIGQKLNPLKMKIRDVMEKDVITISPEKDLFEALIKMRDLNIRHLPVLDNKKMIGLLTLKDILKIQPQLFELLVDKIELKEISRKPAVKEKEGICQTCGNYAENLFDNGGILVCRECREK